MVQVEGEPFWCDAESPDFAGLRSPPYPARKPLPIPESRVVVPDPSFDSSGHDRHHFSGWQYRQGWRVAASKSDEIDSGVRRWCKEFAGLALNVD